MGDRQAFPVLYQWWSWHVDGNGLMSVLVYIDVCWFVQLPAGPASTQQNGTKKAEI